MAVGAVDVTYRVIFQKNLAGVITKELVKAGHRENKIGRTVRELAEAEGAEITTAASIALTSAPGLVGSQQTSAPVPLM